MPNYSFNVFWHGPDEGYIAVCPEFPGLSAFGSSAAAALKEAQDALELFLQTYAAEGWSLPEPEAVPEYSGQFRLRMPKSLHAALSRRANLEGVSLNTLVVAYLSQSVGNAAAFSAVEKRCVAHLQQLSLIASNAFSEIVELHQTASATTTSVQDPLLQSLYAVNPTATPR